MPLSLGTAGCRGSLGGFLSARLGQILKRKLSNYTSNRHWGAVSERGLSLGFQRCWQLAVALFNWQSVLHPTQVQWWGGRWAPAPSAQVSLRLCGLFSVPQPPFHANW